MFVPMTQTMADGTAVTSSYSFSSSSMKEELTDFCQTTCVIEFALVAFRM